MIFSWSSVEHWIVSNRLVLINTPTDPPTFYSRVWKTTSTPDIAIATDNIQKITKREASEQLGGSDHKPVILTLAKQVNTSAGKMPPSWNYKKADWKRFRELTDIYSKSITFSKHSVNKNASNFNSAVLKAAKESIPRGRWHDYKPYWNNTLEKIHKELSEAREEMERNPTPQNVRRHSQLKVDLDKEKQTQTQASWKTKTASLNMERDSQKLWQLTKSLNGDNSERCRTTLQTTNGAVTGKAAANVLARVFEEESTASPLADRVKDVRTQTRAVLQNSATAGFDPCMTECLTLRELEEALKKMKQKKAPGPDGITNEMLKHPGPGAKRTLLRVYNQSWSTGTVPTIWKEAVIRPIPKKGKDKRDPPSYRLISLLSCVGKRLERIINKRLVWHLESNSVLASTQTGYRQFRSTEDQLALLTQDIKDAFQEKKKVLAVFFDLSKAFNKVWKEGLLLKLLRAGVHGKMYKWLSDFLFNRTARVKLDGTISRQVKLKEGVPQGGVVSPTLFLVYTNDITTTVPRHVSNILHADDFAVWCAEEHTTTAAHRIQNTINEVCSWTESWALQLNTTKTVSTLFTLSTAKEKVSLRLNNQQPDANVSWGNPRYTLDVETTPWSSWSQGRQKTGHHEETCRNHLGGQLRHPETGLHRGCKTSCRGCLHNLGYCLKNQQKQARQSAEHGPENYLRCYEKHTNPTNGKDCRPSTFGVQTWVQSCHPRGKAEETDQSSTPPETSAWNQKPHEKKEIQAQVEGPTKRKFWSSGGRQIQQNVRNSQWVSGHRGRAFQKSELKFQALQQREHRLQNCRKHSHWRWYRVAITRAPGPMSSQMALQRTLLGMEAVVLTSVAQMEPPPPSPSQLVTWAPTTEQKYTPWKLPQHSWLRKTATSRISSCCLTPCLLFSLWQMPPPTFAPSSYTTACVLYQTTTE